MGPSPGTVAFCCFLKNKNKTTIDKNTLHVAAQRLGNKLHVFLLLLHHDVPF